MVRRPFKSIGHGWGKGRGDCASLCFLQEQHAIVREIESRLSVCDKVEESIRQGLEKAEALRQSILE
ncbi:MAG: hypothetical protein JEZ04_00675 [Spirochaetales bacterium]|nr:hypothetical protein [Spirochaetales bacterium]